MQEVFFAVTTLGEQLAEHTRESSLFEPIDEHRLRCLACGHRCPIRDGFAGVCKVRFNRGGRLYAPHGYVNTSTIASSAAASVQFSIPSSSFTKWDSGSKS